MTERDRFELDLADALRAYAEEASLQVHPTELARQLATAYPHGRTRFGAWGLGSTVHLAWVPLSLAGLLIAMVGGMLIAGAQPTQDPQAVLPPVGETYTCPAGSNPDVPGPVDQARPRTDTPAAVTLDRRTGKLVALVDVDDSVQTWTYDVCTNTWTQMHPDREPVAVEQVGVDRWAWFAYDVVYDINSDLTIALDRRYGSMWAYDMQADTWTQKRDAPDAPTDTRLGAYDTLTTRVIAAKDADPAELWSYDVEADVWAPIHQTNTLGGGLAYLPFVYDASVDQIVAYQWRVPYDTSDQQTWLFDLPTGTWSRSTAETPSIPCGWIAVSPAIVYDEATKRTVVICGSRLASYDAAADRWEVVEYETDFGWNPPPTVYDPVNERLVAYGDSGQVVAFNPRTGDWTILLEPSPGEPSPSPT